MNAHKSVVLYYIAARSMWTQSETTEAVLADGETSQSFVAVLDLLMRMQLGDYPDLLEAFQEEQGNDVPVLLDMEPLDNTAELDERCIEMMRQAFVRSLYPTFDKYVSGIQQYRELYSSNAIAAAIPDYFPFYIGKIEAYAKKLKPPLALPDYEEATVRHDIGVYLHELFEIKNIYQQFSTNTAALDGFKENEVEEKKEASREGWRQSLVGAAIGAVFTIFVGLLPFWLTVGSSS